MAATGKTPILLYGSTTPTNTPSAGNLTNSSDGCEIAINVADKNLFFKDATNTVNTVPIRQSSASSNGWLSSTDWSTFNSKVSSQWVTSGSNIYYTTGTVNIGATDPSYRLDVAAGDTTAGLGYAMRLRTNATAGAASLQFTDNPVSAQLGIITCDTSGNLKFSSSGGQAMQLHASKGVSIGNTTDPGATNLSVTTNGLFGTPNSGSITQINTNSLYCSQPVSASLMRSAAIVTNSNSGYIGFDFKGIDVVNYSALPSTGSVIGTMLSLNALNNSMTALGTYSVTVGATNRDLYIDNTGLIGYVSSTKESKKNIQEITDTDWLLKLTPVTFNRRKKETVIDESAKKGYVEVYTEETYSELEYGLIAEEVESVNKELCFYDETENGLELRGVHYGKLATPMLKLLQQQQQLIDALSKRISLLEGK